MADVDRDGIADVPTFTGSSGVPPLFRIASRALLIILFFPISCRNGFISIFLLSSAASPGRRFLGAFLPTAPRVPLRNLDPGRRRPPPRATFSPAHRSPEGQRNLRILQEPDVKGFSRANPSTGTPAAARVNRIPRTWAGGSPPREHVIPIHFPEPRAPCSPARRPPS